MAWAEENGIDIGWFGCGEEWPDDDDMYDDDGEPLYYRMTSIRTRPKYPRIHDSSLRPKHILPKPTVNDVLLDLFPSEEDKLHKRIRELEKKVAKLEAQLSYANDSGGGWCSNYGEINR